MSRKDYLTNRKPQSGNKRSHALNHSRKVWNLNLQSTVITLPSGQKKKVKVSTRTLKTLRKNAKVKAANKKVKTVKAK